MAGLSIPPSALKTTVAVSPAREGKRSCKRSKARCDSVPGEEKLLENAFPTTLLRTPMPMNTRIHATRTRRRRR